MSLTPSPRAALLRRIAILALSTATLAGCTTFGDGYYDDYGYGYAGGYSDYDCDPYVGFDDYYGCDSAYGYGDIGYRGGWYDNYYYPGYGLYIFNRSGQRYAMRDYHRRYWSGQRGNWYRQHHGRRGPGQYQGGWGDGQGRGGEWRDRDRDHDGRGRDYDGRPRGRGDWQRPDGAAGQSTGAVSNPGRTWTGRGRDRGDRAGQPGTTGGAGGWGGRWRQPTANGDEGAAAARPGRFGAPPASGNAAAPRPRPDPRQFRQQDGRVERSGSARAPAAAPAPAPSAGASARSFPQPRAGGWRGGRNRTPQ